MNIDKHKKRLRNPVAKNLVITTEQNPLEKRNNCDHTNWWVFRKIMQKNRIIIILTLYENSYFGLQYFRGTSKETPSLKPHTPIIVGPSLLLHRKFLSQPISTPPGVGNPQVPRVSRRGRGYAQSPGVRDFCWATHIQTQIPTQNPLHSPTQGGNFGPKKIV